MCKLTQSLYSLVNTIRQYQSPVTQNWNSVANIFFGQQLYTYRILWFRWCALRVECLWGFCLFYFEFNNASQISHSSQLLYISWQFSIRCILLCAYHIDCRLGWGWGCGGEGWGSGVAIYDTSLKRILNSNFAFWNRVCSYRHDVIK